MPRTRRSSNSADSSVDPVVPLITSALAAMPRRSRNELIGFLEFWRELPGEDRAVFAKTVNPALSEESVACLCGVSIRTLQRWVRYQESKIKLKDYLHRRPWPTKRQRSKSGKWVELSNAWAS